VQPRDQGAPSFCCLRHIQILKAKIQQLRDALRAQIPSRQELAAQPWLKPIAAHLLDPKLWTAQHESVARGAAIGVFWAFVIPFAQIIFAAAHCVWWRANIPVAAAITFITNPFTVGFWLYLAYNVGSLMIDAPPPSAIPEGAAISQWLIAIGWPAVGHGTICRWRRCCLLYAGQGRLASAHCLENPSAPAYLIARTIALAVGSESQLP
jgi:uncharacterized protein